MNIAKHMEAVFVVALAAAASSSFITNPLQQAHAGARARPAAIEDSSIATETKMAVVVVKGKRPTSPQPTLLADRRAGGSRI